MDFILLIINMTVYQQKIVMNDPTVNVFKHDIDPCDWDDINIPSKTDD